MPITEEAVVEEVVVVDENQVKAGESGEAGAPADPEKKPDDEPKAAEQADEVTVTIGDEKPKEEDTPAPEWVRELRKNHREAQKRIKELEGKLTADPKAPELGTKPTLEGCDYDSDKFERAIESWHEKKRQIEAQAQTKAQEEEEGKKAWKAKMDAYGEAKQSLKVKDFDDAENTVLDLISVTQQGIIVQGADNPALVIYAIGKNPAKAKEMAEIKDPIKFAFAISKLESQLKVQSKKAIPPPEKVITGTGRSSGSVDSALERLRADAEKTGDFTKVVQYKRDKKFDKS